MTLSTCDTCVCSLKMLCIITVCFYGNLRPGLKSGTIAAGDMPMAYLSHRGQQATLLKVSLLDLMSVTWSLHRYLPRGSHMSIT